MAKFIDLLPVVRSIAEENRGRSPHWIARDFVLEQSLIREGAEIIVVLDRQERFVAAGTQDLCDAVDFPPTIQTLLQDPSAELVIHHNHPPSEEPFFSGTDMNALASNCGIGWLLLHTVTGYSAIRASDHLFMVEPSGAVPALALPAAYRAGQTSAQFAIFQADLDVAPHMMEALAPELVLQALHQAGAIHYCSSLKTGLNHGQQQTLIEHIRSECVAGDPARFGGAAIWRGPPRPAVSSTSGGSAGSDRLTPVSYPSTLEAGFERFVAILSRADAPSHDPGAPRRPQPPQFPETG